MADSGIAEFLNLKRGNLRGWISQETFDGRPAGVIISQRTPVSRETCRDQALRCGQGWSE